MPELILVIALAVAVTFAMVLAVKNLKYKKTVKYLRKTAESFENLNNREILEHSNLKGQHIEGEIGKLSDAIFAILTRLIESAEDEKKQKEYLKDIISDISHQLKTPIASLTVFTDLMTESVTEKLDLIPGEEEELITSQNSMNSEEFEAKTVALLEEESQLKRNLNMLQQQSQQLDRMKWLITSLLQLARIEADSVTFEKKDTNLFELMEFSAGSLEELAKTRSVSIQVTGDEAVAATDSEWLREAMVNIIKNAIEYSPKGGEVEIQVRKTPIAAKISVTDHGPGINEEDRIRVFRRFYKTNQHAVNPNSIGIGLALSKSIIEGVGGRIYIESRTKEECKKDQESFTTMNVIL